MENHPIPQDVTGFKFKLIGSVTVKQFLYLLGFGILTTICFVLHINFLLRIPLMLFFASIGAALAFVPIEGRPMDTMIVNFAKTIPAENRFVYRKRGADLASFKVFSTPKQFAQAIAHPQAPIVKDPNEDKRAILISRLRNSSFRPDETETKTLNNINSYFTDSSAKIQVLPDLPNQVADDEAETIAAKEKFDKIEEMKQAAEEEKMQQQQKAATTPKALPNQEPAPAVIEEKNNLKLSNQQSSQEVPQTNTPPQAVPEKINPSLSAGFPTLPDIGNVVMGIVRDPRGKSLQNVLVEVVDTNALPVRAFKTNALGQFASATPLANGKYKVSFDDPLKQHSFGIIDLNLTGEIFQPLEITSTDAREKLRQELFGGTSASA